MCQECGCAVTTAAVTISTTTLDHHHPDHHDHDHDTLAPAGLVGAILRQNDLDAAHNREHLRARGILAINLMSSPGSGKTSLLEATIEALGGRWRIAVIEGDLETENDAERIRAKGVPAVQITTGQTCHLDARMLHDALHRIDLDAIDLLFIENVGNLVCPAGFDLGQDANVVLLAVTEGDDKPAKYPVMFRTADLVLLSKADLLPYLDDFSPDTARAHVRALANPVDVLEISARRPQTLAPWISWLEQRLVAMRAGVPAQA